MMSAAENYTTTLDFLENGNMILVMLKNYSFPNLPTCM